MTREEIKQALLDYGWNAAERARIAEIIRAVETDEECSQAAGDYDELRDVMAGPELDEEPEGGWDAFEAGLLEVSTARRPIPWWKVGAIAASLLIAAIVVRLAPPRPQAVRQTDGQTELAGLRFTPGEIRENVGAFAEVVDLFDRRANWLLLSGKASELGLGAEREAAPERVLLFRLSVSRAGRPISNADLVIVPGQAADVVVPCEAGQQIRYQLSTSTEQPTRLTLWVELQQDGQRGETLAALATDLHIQPGDVLPAGQMVTSSGEFDVCVSFSEANALEIRQ